MYYDDQPKRFNLVSGLVCGAVLGAGLALLFSPARPARGLRKLRRGAAGLGREAARELRRGTREAARSFAALREAARERAARTAEEVPGEAPGPRPGAAGPAGSGPVLRARPRQS